MSFFNLKTSWSNAELVILKLCIASAYILVGAYFHKFVRHYYWVFVILFAVTVIWGVYLWLAKMKQSSGTK